MQVSTCNSNNTSIRHYKAMTKKKSICQVEPLTNAFNKSTHQHVNISTC